MFKLLPIIACDFYKISHRIQYPEGTQFVYSNLTPRSGKLFKGKNKNNLVWFGGAYAIRRIHDLFEENFFKQPLFEIIAEYTKIIKNSLGDANPIVEHIQKLHGLGYLPIKIKMLAEGSIVPYQVPVLTIKNTLPDFYWVTNFLETILSCEIWQASCSASLAFDFRIACETFARDTADPRFYDEAMSWLKFQCHDFSMRGMSSTESAIASGLGHLTCFLGTDTIPAIQAAEYYYKADSDKEIIGASVPASEHSVMSAGGLDELSVFKRFITELYPSGIISIVSDTYDFFGVLKNILPKLKDEIMARDGKVVIRPDSGSPADIICGTPIFQTIEETNNITKEKKVIGFDKGAIDYLWETFGGYINEKGYKVLDSHIGLIYGDSITLEVQEDIFQRLKFKKFSTENIIFGVGSYTYQFNTRDSQGWAVKATYCEINGNGVEIFKKPKTDSGKNSKRGLLAVSKQMIWPDGDIHSFIVKDQVSKLEEQQGELKTVYKNGLFINENLLSLSEIRKKIDKHVYWIVEAVCGAIKQMQSVQENAENINKH